MCYLFQKVKETSIVEDPWPHIMIEEALEPNFAKSLLETFPDSNKFHHGYDGTPNWSKFTTENIERASETYDMLEEIFNAPHTPYSHHELNLNLYQNASIDLIRDWHTDGREKKFQILLYLGEEDGGEFELLNDSKTLTYPYKHNRLIVWHNTKETQHRFWSVVGNRYTVSMPLYSYPQTYL
jgi:hypothetical protein